MVQCIIGKIKQMFILLLFIVLLLNSCVFNFEISEDSYIDSSSDKTSNPTESLSESEVSNDISESTNPIDLGEIAELLLNEMTVEEKVGQLFLVRCYPNKAVKDIQRLGLGGLVLFASDFNKSADKVKKDIHSYQNASKYGLIIAVDEEGGTVVRVSKYKQFRDMPFSSPYDIYSSGGFELIRNTTIEKAKLLTSLGINVNLAPVCDLPTSEKSFIYSRSFGTEPILASEFVKITINESTKNGLGSVLKHFPGYGDNGDTHIGYSFDNRSLESFRNRDFLPFKSGIDAGVGAVMFSHITITDIDKENPASLSLAVHRILREELNFDGVIITDDLSMDAVKKYIDIKTVGKKAFLAGNDIICTSDYDILYNSILEGVREGEITTQRLDESVIRILLWKLELGIIPIPQ